MTKHNDAALHLLHASILAQRGEFTQALNALPVRDELSTPSLTSWWYVIQVRATTDENSSKVESILSEFRSWALHHQDDDEVKSRFYRVRGEQDYRNDLYESAAEHHANGLRLTKRPDTKASSQLGLAAAYMEIDDQAKALVYATQALGHATTALNMRSLTRAKRTIMEIHYRQRQYGEPDHVLLEEIRCYGLERVESPTFLVMAAHAWRLQDYPLASRLSLQGAEIFEARGLMNQALLCRAISAASTRSASDDLVSTIATSIPTGRLKPDLLMIQTIGLLRHIPSLADTLHPVARNFAATIHTSHKTRPLTVMSVEEALREH